MSTIRYETETGRLRLDRSAFDALVSVHDHGQAGEATDHAVVTELRAAGVLDDHGIPHSTVGAAVAAVAEPVCRLVLRTQDAHGRKELHEGWIAGHAAALLLAAGDDLYELVSLHPSFLPEAIARLVGLGPRPLPGDAIPVRLAARTIDDLTGSDPARRTATARRLLKAASGPRERATAQALGSGARFRWEAATSWTPTLGAAGMRAMHVLDTPAGLWLLEPAGAALLACPTTPTIVWRLLINLLPRDGELNRRHRRL